MSLKKIIILSLVLTLIIFSFFLIRFSIFSNNSDEEVKINLRERAYQEFLEDPSRKIFVSTNIDLNQEKENFLEIRNINNRESNFRIILSLGNCADNSSVFDVGIVENIILRPNEIQKISMDLTRISGESTCLYYLEIIDSTTEELYDKRSIFVK